MTQILLTYDDSWNHDDLKDAADQLEDCLPGVVKAVAVEHCGKCGEKKPAFGLNPKYESGRYIDLQGSVSALSRWVHERDEEAIIEHMAKVDLPNLTRMRDAINKAIEQVSGDRSCSNCGNDPGRGCPMAGKSCYPGKFENWKPKETP